MPKLTANYHHNSIRFEISMSNHSEKNILLITFGKFTIEPINHS